jgi:hypothetical protein
MAKGVPEPPSEAEIKAAEVEQERRIAFEEEKRQYLANVGAYETMAQTYLMRSQDTSFEYQDPDAQTLPPPEALRVPERFQARSLEEANALELQGYDWADAENLGYNREERIETQRSAMLSNYYGRLLDELRGGLTDEFTRYFTTGNYAGARGQGYLYTVREATRQALDNARNMTTEQIARGEYLRGTRLEGGYYGSMAQNYMQRYFPDIERYMA